MLALAVPVSTLLAASGDAVSAAPHRVSVLATAAAKPGLLPAVAGNRVAASSARIQPKVLPAGVAPEKGKGMQVRTILAARAVSAQFPEILDIGGVRSDPLKWHPHGMAIDVMIPGHHSPEGIALGDRVLAYVLENADRFGLEHIIWRQTYYPRQGAPRRMRSRGGDTANHYDHLHIATHGGGYPRGSETYLR